MDGNWSRQETQALLLFVSTQGRNNWERIPASLAKRHSPAECQERFNKIYTFAQQNMSRGTYPVRVQKRRKVRKKRKRKVEPTRDVEPKLTRKSARLLGVQKKVYTYYDGLDQMLDREKKENMDQEDEYAEKI